MGTTNIKETISSTKDDGPAGRGRGRYLLVGAVLTATVAIAVTGWVVSRDTEPATPAADGPDADSVAASFMVAGHGYDLDEAALLLADDAEVVGTANGEEWLADRAWDEAAGFKLARLSCREGDTTSSGTAVTCSYAFHGLGSEQLNHRGPYGGGVADLTVLDGQITRVEESWPFETNGFSSQMWEPVQAWISLQHPAAASILYGDDPNQSAAEHETELKLWRQNIAEYVASHQ